VSTIFAVSDGSGTTAERVVSAALTQFDSPQVTIRRYGNVRSAGRVQEVVAEAAQVDGFIVHTLVSEESRRVMLQEGRRNNVTTIDLMGPLLARLSEVLEASPRSEPGIFQAFDNSYMQRIEAINFTVRHDDGRSIHDIDEAEIVLVGVSRTSKTPLSIYLSYRGWKTANVPIVLGMAPPPQLFMLPRRRVVGLVVEPKHLSVLRQVRAQHMGILPQGYADLEHVREEVAYAYELFDRRRDWPLVDVTSKSIEEVAAEVVTLLGRSSKRLDVGGF
jgi:regulator of PEP synthase PpsR (kinase-PPPase family)